MTSPSKKIPVARGKFPWQAAFQMIKDPISFLKNRQSELGQLYRIDAPKPFIVVSNHDHIKQILQTNWRKYEKGPAFKGFALILGDGLLNSEGKKWRRQRKMIQPSFNKEHVESLTGKMLQTAEDLVSGWEKSGRIFEPLEIKSELTGYSLDVISSLMLGEFSAQKYKDKLIPLLMQQYEIVLKYNRSFIKLPTWVPTWRNIKYHKRKRQLEKIVSEIISVKKENPDEFLFSAMITAKDDNDQTMSNEELRDEFLTLYISGFETTGNALAWTFLLLAKHPKIQEKLFQEIESFNQNNQTIIKTLMQTEWLNAIVRETLRLYPSAWIISRKSKEADEIDGVIIPAKTNMLLCPFMAHRDPAHWIDPEVFRPERFIGTKNHASYLPFGLGARMCIGNHFSHLEMIIVVYTVCKKYRIQLAVDRDFEVEPRIIIQPKGYVFIALEAR